MALDPVTAALDVGGKLIDRLWPDPAQRDQAKLALLKMQQDGSLAELTADTDLAKGQIAINQAEASNPSVYVSGWRPAIGWVCALGLLWEVFLGSFLTWLTNLAAGHIQPPTFDTATTTAVLIPLLGFGGYRTIEKMNGVARAK